MPTNDSGKKPLCEGIKYGLLTLFFSYFPSVIVGIIEGIRFNYFPSFEFYFDSGGMIAIWIPIVTMLMISLYDLKAKTSFPKLADSFSFLLLVIAFLSVAFYIAFFLDVIYYKDWVKWLSCSILFFLFICLGLSKYLEESSLKDVKTTRKNDQESLEKRLNNIKDK